VAILLNGHQLDHLPQGLLHLLHSSSLAHHHTGVQGPRHST